MADIVGMARFSICVAGIVLTSFTVFAQPPNGGGPGAVLGIVEIPEMFFVDPNTGQYAPRAALAVYTAASESRVLAHISSPAAIDDAEYGYEEAGALVYGRENGFFLIRTSRGVGWLSPHNAGSFHPLEELIRRGLTDLTDAWDGS